MYLNELQMESIWQLNESSYSLDSFGLLTWQIEILDIYGGYQKSDKSKRKSYSDASLQQSLLVIQKKEKKYSHFFVLWLF